MIKDINIYTNKKNKVIFAMICTALWGSAFPAVKVGYSLFNIEAYDVGSKLLFAGYRFALAGIIVLLLQLYSKKNIFIVSKEGFKEITYLGFIQTTFQYLFFYIGMSFTSGVRASILNGLGTFFTIILANYFLKDDKVTKNKILGCIIGFLGVILVNLSGNNISEGSFSIKGEGLIILSTLMLSISSVYSKKITKKYDPQIVTGYQLFIGGIILIILGFFLNGRLNGFTIKSTTLLIYMSLISAVAFTIWTLLIKYNEVSKVAIFNFLMPIFGTAFSGIFLGENIFNINIIISLILVSAGIYLANSNKEIK